MNPEQYRPAPDHQQRVSNDLSVMQHGETVITTIKRHPIGLIITYTIAGLAVAIVGAMAYAIAPALAGEGSNSIGGVSTGVVLAVALLAVLYCLVASVVYWGNRWVVTSDSITQVSQTGLFTRQSSQLSLGNLEDVTAEQNGLLTHLFNYGLLKVETAGERSKFQFIYCPNPNYYAQTILAARETFEQGHHYGGVNTNTNA